jgi:hypothetical protein
MLAACGDADVKVHVPGDSITGDVAAPVDTVVQPMVRVDTLVEQRTDTVVIDNGPPRDTLGKQVAGPVVTQKDRRMIDAWLAAHADSLNQYGDPIGTMYTGGTPLFDETTGATIDRYTYIVRKHPDVPWRSFIRAPASGAGKRTSGLILPDDGSGGLDVQVRAGAVSPEQDSQSPVTRPDGGSSYGDSSGPR